MLYVDINYVGRGGMLCSVLTPILLAEVGLYALDSDDNNLSRMVVEK